MRLCARERIGAEKSRAFLPEREREREKRRGIAHFGCESRSFRGRRVMAKAREIEKERKKERKKKREKGIRKGVLFIHYRESYHTLSHRGKKENKKKTCSLFTALAC